MYKHTKMQKYTMLFSKVSNTSLSNGQTVKLALFLQLYSMNSLFKVVQWPIRKPRFFFQKSKFGWRFSKLLNQCQFPNKFNFSMNTIFLKHVLSFIIRFYDFLHQFSFFFIIFHDIRSNIHGI